MAEVTQLSTFYKLFFRFTASKGLIFLSENGIFESKPCKQYGRTYTQRMVLIGPFLLKTMRTIEDKNIPSRREQNFNSGSINLFIAICDYNGGKKRRTKRYPTETLTQCPEGIPRNGSFHFYPHTPYGRQDSNRSF